MDNDKPFKFDLIHNTIGCICILCNNKYYPYNDPFIYVINSQTKKEITYELCLNCLEPILNLNCSKCNKLINEPYYNVYFNLKTKTKYCSNCV